MRVMGLMLLMVSCICLARPANAQQRSELALRLDSAAAHTRLPPAVSDLGAAGDELQQSGRSRWLIGAISGFVIGAAVTAVVLHSGGSSSLCDRSQNQDAMSSGECLALTAGGGIVGAGIGALVGSRFKDAKLRY